MLKDKQQIEFLLSDSNLTVNVPRDGYWFGQEVIELVEFIQDKTWKQAVDLGCGDGIIPMLLARKQLADEIWAIEIDSNLCKRAENNVQRNNLTGQIYIKNKDLRKLKNLFKRGSFDLITSNPPFFAANKDHQNLNLSEKSARQETKGTLRHFLQAANYLGSRKADLYLLYHPSRIDYLFAELKNTQFQCKHLQILHHADGRALFVLCHGVKSGKSGLTILPPKTLGKSMKFDQRGQ